MERRGIEVQYAVVADAESLEATEGPVDGRVVALAAGKLGTTRLIDNMVLNDGEET
jgi:pantothenate synthetase